MDTSERLDKVQAVFAKVTFRTTDEQIKQYADEICSIGDYNRAHAVFYLHRRRGIDSVPWPSVD